MGLVLTSRVCRPARRKAALGLRGSRQLMQPDESWVTFDDFADNADDWSGTEELAAYLGAAESGAAATPAAAAGSSQPFAATATVNNDGTANSPFSESLLQTHSVPQNRRGSGAGQLVVLNALEAT